MQVTAIVSGKVQGVYFRVSTQEVAFELGVIGYANNLPNGDVEVAIEGPDDKVERLLEWLQQGPDMARVDKVETVLSEKLLTQAFLVG